MNYIDCVALWMISLQCLYSRLRRNHIFTHASLDVGGTWEFGWRKTWKHLMEKHDWFLPNQVKNWDFFNKQLGENESSFQQCLGKWQKSRWALYLIHFFRTSWFLWASRVFVKVSQSQVRNELSSYLSRSLQSYFFSLVHSKK